MEIKKFGQMMAKEVNDTLGEEFSVEYSDILKNNGVIYHALTIRRKGQNISPTIYIDKMFESYKKGCLLMQLVDETVNIYRQSAPEKELDMNFFYDFSKASGNLFFKVVNYEKNVKKLGEVPYKRFMDLAMVPLCLVKSKSFGEGTITIQNSLLKIWEVSEEELWENVLDSAEKIAPPKVRGLLDVLSDITGGSMEDCGMNSVFVVSNETGNLGAGAAFYPGLLRGLANDFETDLFIIPSSVHEILIMPDRGPEMDATALKEIIREVNETTVAEDDILSDNLYKYDFETDKIYMVKDA